MARVYSAALLARYRGLSDIPPEEWLDFFPNTDQTWTPEDENYLLDWWGIDDVMDLAYALGRPPWGLQRQVCKLRKEGFEIDYIRSQVNKDEPTHPQTAVNALGSVDGRQSGKPQQRTPGNHPWRRNINHHRRQHAAFATGEVATSSLQ